MQNEHPVSHEDGKKRCFEIRRARRALQCGVECDYCGEFVIRLPVIRDGLVKCWPCEDNNWREWVSAVGTGY